MEDQEAEYADGSSEWVQVEPREQEDRVVAFLNSLRGSVSHDIMATVWAMWDRLQEREGDLPDWLTALLEVKDADDVLAFLDGSPGWRTDATVSQVAVVMDQLLDLAAEGKFVSKRTFAFKNVARERKEIRAMVMALLFAKRAMFEVYNDDSATMYETLNALQNNCIDLGKRLFFRFVDHIDDLQRRTRSMLDKYSSEIAELLLLRKIYAAFGVLVNQFILTSLTTTSETGAESFASLHKVIKYDSFASVIPGFERFTERVRNCDKIQQSLENVAFVRLRHVINCMACIYTVPGLDTSVFEATFFRVLSEEFCKVAHNVPPGTRDEHAETEHAETEHADEPEDTRPECEAHRRAVIAKRLGEPGLRQLLYDEFPQEYGVTPTKSLCRRLQSKFHPDKDRSGCGHEASAAVNDLCSSVRGGGDTSPTYVVSCTALLAVTLATSLFGAW